MEILTKSLQTSCVVKRLLTAYDEPEPHWDGNYVLICHPDGLSMWHHPTFAAGYHRAIAMCLDLYQQESLFLPSDLDFTALIDEQLPETVSSDFVNEWRTGFMFAWVLMWYRPVERHQFKQLQAQASGCRKFTLSHDFTAIQEENA